MADDEDLAELRERRREWWSRVWSTAVGVYLGGLALGGTAFVIADELVERF